MKKAATTAQSLASALSHEAADKRIDILRLVGVSGSISQAARDAKVSYKAAWQAIDTLTNLAGVALVTSAVGGSGGGGARITPAGQKLLSIAKLLNETRNQVFASFQSNELLLPRALPVLSSLGVRTSMRNQFPCQIAKLEVKGQVARVYLSLPDNGLLISRITKASAELLGLKKRSRRAGAVQSHSGCGDSPCLPGSAVSGNTTLTFNSPVPQRSSGAREPQRFG